MIPHKSGYKNTDPECRTSGIVWCVFLGPLQSMSDDEIRNLLTDEPYRTNTRYRFLRPYDGQPGEIYAHPLCVRRTALRTLVTQHTGIDC